MVSLSIFFVYFSFLKDLYLPPYSSFSLLFLPIRSCWLSITFLSLLKISLWSIIIPSFCQFSLFFLQSLIQSRGNSGKDYLVIILIFFALRRQESFRQIHIDYRIYWLFFILAITSFNLYEALKSVSHEQLRNCCDLA